MTLTSNSSVTEAPSGRLSARALTAILGLGLLSFALGALRQFPDFVAQDGLAGALFTTSLVGGIPLAVGAVLLWWTVRGWQIEPEPVWTRALRYGAAGLFVWGLIGTIGIVSYYSAMQGRDAGVAPVMAWLSAPVGFVIGAATALFRRPRR